MAKHCSSIHTVQINAEGPEESPFPLPASRRELLENSAVSPLFPLPKLYEAIPPVLETVGLNNENNEITT